MSLMKTSIDKHNVFYLYMNELNKMNLNSHMQYYIQYNSVSVFHRVLQWFKWTINESPGTVDEIWDAELYSGLAQTFCMTLSKSINLLISDRVRYLNIFENIGLSLS